MKLELKGVGKQYRSDFWGLKDFTLTLEPGVLGLLGENGAGKSTLMRIISTITKATQGSVLWNGIDIFKNPNAIRMELGYLPQDFGVYQHLNAVEFLEYIAAIKGVNKKDTKRRIEELLQVVNLVEARKRVLGSYSGGMKQRIGIAQALINDPKILIVDEPTVGLDPIERVRFRNLLTDLSGERIVIFSTHIVSDVEATAGRIAIISKGQLLHASDPERLLQTVKDKVWELVVTDKEVQELRKKLIISSTIRSITGVQLKVVSDTAPSPDAIPAAPSMEDAYLYCISGKRESGLNG